LLANLRNKAQFAAAKRKAGEDGMVCGYLDSDGRPHYFVVPKDATEADVRRIAFQVRHGRPMTPAEELLDAFYNNELIDEYKGSLQRYINEYQDHKARWTRKLEEVKGAASH